MTLAELNQLLQERAALFDKIGAATLIAAETYRASGTATATQKLWAEEVFRSPVSWRDTMYNAVLAANAGATVVQVQTAADSAVQASVNAAATLFAG